MTDHSNWWWKSMRKKTGLTDEGIREMFVENGRIGGKAKVPKGLGSAKLSESKKQEIRSKGGKTIQDIRRRRREG